MSACDPSLPIADVGFDGEFRRYSGHDMLSWSFVEIDPQRARVHAGHTNALQELTNYYPARDRSFHELLVKWPQSAAIEGQLNSTDWSR
jgi:hypothetical protein